MLVLACLWGIEAESAKKCSQRCCLGERLIDGLADQFTPLPSRRALSRSITSSVLRRAASRLSWAWIAFSRRLPRGASPPALGGRRNISAYRSDEVGDEHGKQTERNA